MTYIINNNFINFLHKHTFTEDKLMYCNADFVIGGKALSDWLLMLPDIRSLNDILERLGVS